MSFCVAGEALCDIPTCLIMCQKCQNCRKSRTKCWFSASTMLVFCIHMSCLESLVCLWRRRVYGWKLENMSFSNVSKQVVPSFCVAGVALCDIRTCLITCGKCQNWRESRTKCSFWCTLSCVIRSSRMASMSWKALLAARHCVATPVLLSWRENRSRAMTLFHCSTIGLSINIFISSHNRYFNIVIFNIRVSIRVRGLHLVQRLF